MASKRKQQQFILEAIFIDWLSWNEQNNIWETIVKLLNKKQRETIIAMCKSEYPDSFLKTLIDLGLVDEDEEDCYE